LQSKFRLGRHQIVAIGLVVLMIVGIGLAVKGWCLRASLGVEPPPRRGESGGFLLFGSQFINRSDISEIYLKVDHLDLISNTATVNIHVSFSAWFSPTETLVFGAQVPHNFTGLDLWVEMQRDLPTGSESVHAPTCGHSRFVACMPARAPVGDLSYFYAVVNRSSETGGLFSKFIFEANFLWHNCSQRYSFTDFSLVVQFSFDFDFDRYTLNPFVVLPLSTSEARISRLSLALPRESRLMALNPGADMHTFANDTFSYIWDVRKRSIAPLVASTAFALDFEMNNLVEEKEERLFDSALYLGLGIPTAISSISSLATWYTSPLRSRTSTRKNSNR
jgi:hypothetical protein